MVAKPGGILAQMGVQVKLPEYLDLGLFLKM